MKSILQRRRFSQPARPPHETGDDQCGRRTGGHRHRVLRSVDLEAGTRPSKKVVQARGGDDGKSDRRNDAAPKGQQRDDDHIDETSCTEIEVEPEAKRLQVKALASVPEFVKEGRPRRVA